MMIDTDDVTVFIADDRRLGATLAGDTTELRKMFTENFSYTHSNGLREDGSAYLERIDSGAVRYLAMQREEARVIIDGRTAIVEGVARMTYEPRGGRATMLRTLYLAIWLQSGTAWRISHYASTTAPSD